MQSLLGSSLDEVNMFAALSACNIAPVYFSANISSPAEAETLVRLCLGVSRKLNFVQSCPAALFISSIFCNLSRITYYTALLCEEGVLPLLLAILANRDEAVVTDNCTEAFVNLSMNRKNQRGIPLFPILILSYPIIIIITIKYK